MSRKLSPGHGFLQATTCIPKPAVRRPLTSILDHRPQTVRHRSDLLYNAITPQEKLLSNIRRVQKQKHPTRRAAQAR